MTRAPCKCGHELHTNRTCSKCACSRSCPDYVAKAKAEGRAPTQAERDLTAQLVKQTRWTSPKRTHPKRECAYCCGEFRPRRKDQTMCCGDCQTRHHRARTRTEPPLEPVYREDGFSQERQWATGNGLLTPAEAYEHDLRVWRAHQEAARPLPQAHTSHSGAT